MSFDDRLNKEGTNGSFSSAGFGSRERTAMMPASLDDASQALRSEISGHIQYQCHQIDGFLEQRLQAYMHEVQRLVTLQGVLLEQVEGPAKDQSYNNGNIYYSHACQPEAAQEASCGLGKFYEIGDPEQESVQGGDLDDLVDQINSGIRCVGRAEGTTEGNDHVVRKPYSHDGLKWDDIGFQSQDVGYGRIEIERAAKKVGVEKNNKFMQLVFRGAEWFGTLQEPERKGALAKLVRSKKFEALCLIVILVNAISSLLETNHRLVILSDERAPSFEAIEVSCTAFYVIELCIKVAVHREFFFINRDWRWNIFDTILVFVGVLDYLMVAVMSSTSSKMDTGYLRFARILRISKIFRIVRLLRFFRELRLMLNCVMGSFTALMWGFVLLASLTIVFALMVTQQIASFLIENKNGQQEPMLKSFGSVQRAMLTLFQCISGGRDWSDAYALVAQTGTLNTILFLFYILFIWLSLTNIITSIFVDKAMKLAQPDMDDMLFTKRKQDIADAKELKELFAKMDTTNKGMMSRAEFQEFMHDWAMIESLELRGLAIKDAELFFNMLATIADVDEIDVDTFVTGCLKMKGAAMNVDVVAVQYESSMIKKDQRRMFAKMTKDLQHIGKMLESVKQPLPIEPSNIAYV